MTVYYLDASVWVKCYHREVGTTWMRRLVAEGASLACASLGLVEVLATLARKGRAGFISELALQPKIDAVRADWQRAIQVNLSSDVLEVAATQARYLALRGADAVHLASAMVLSRRLEAVGDQVTVVTSDRELAEAARIVNLNVLNPEAEEAQLPETPRGRPN
jgi:uncharacterized protein